MEMTSDVMAERIVEVAGAVLALSVTGLLMSARRRSRRRRWATISSPRRLDAHHGAHDGLRIAAEEEHLEHVVHCATVGHAVTSSPSSPVAVAARRHDAKSAEIEQEMERLEKLSQSLARREDRLELRLMEYHGDREHDAAVRELANRAAVTATEAKFLHLRVDALSEENARLKAEMSKLEAEMDRFARAQAKIRELKEQLRRSKEDAMVTIASLRDRAAEALDGADMDGDITELEAEAAELRDVNARLEEENAVLAQRLRSAEHFSSSIDRVLRDDDTVERLRETNEQLSAEVEQLRDEHYGHVEELVYLKWINACMRYELRHFRPEDGQPTARDLSKAASFQSKQAARQLLVQYYDIFGDYDSAASETDRSSAASRTPNRDGEGGATPAPAPNKKKVDLLKGLKKLFSRSANRAGKNAAASASTNDIAAIAPPPPHIWSPSLESTMTHESPERRIEKQLPWSSSRDAGEQKLVAGSARSKSDLGGAEGRREANRRRFQSFRPEHPALAGRGAAVRAPEKDELKQYAVELKKRLKM